MDIAVAMKQIPDLQQVRVKDGKAVLRGVPLTFGEIDKRALAAAVALRDSTEGTVHVVSVGSEDLEDTVSEALAAGGDSATLIADDDFADLDSAQAARYLAWAISNLDSCDLVLFGEASGDDSSGQVASRVAEILGWPLIGYASKIDATGKQITAECSYETHVETLVATLPAVVSVVSDIAEPKIPSVSGILKAGRKPKDVLDSTDVDFDDVDPSISTVSTHEPNNERRGITVDSVDSLIDALTSDKIL